MMNKEEAAVVELHEKFVACYEEIWPHIDELQMKYQSPVMLETLAWLIGGYFAEFHGFSEELLSKNLDTLVLKVRQSVVSHRSQQHG